MLIALVVSNVAAVSALPVTSPIKLPDVLISSVPKSHSVPAAV